MKPATKNAGYPETPELDRLREATEEFHTQSIGEFLDWLNQHGYVVCEWSAIQNEYTPSRQSINQWLNEYTGINPDRVEEERRAILAYLAEKNRQTQNG